MSSKFLKIKIKTLTGEIKNIKLEEHKTKSQYRNLKTMQGYEAKYQKEVSTFWGLRRHRTKLSMKSRDSHLAYAYVRGKKYRQTENNGNPVRTWIWSYPDKSYVPIYWIDIENIARMASEYGDIEVDGSEIARWVHEDDLLGVIADMDAAEEAAEVAA
jgi:hypothetical protein